MPPFIPFHHRRGAVRTGPAGRRPPTTFVFFVPILCFTILLAPTFACAASTFGGGAQNDGKGSHLAHHIGRSGLRSRGPAKRVAITLDRPSAWAMLMQPLSLDLL